MILDLHIHSTYSDGTNSPVEIVSMAAKKGLTVISITDHDTMAGTQESIEAGKREGLQVIPGLELSVVHEGKPIHILGYWMDEHNKELQAGLNRIQYERDERNRKIIHKLVKLGIPVTEEELDVCSKHGQAGRPHIGSMLIKHGVVKNINQAFQHYLKKDRCAYVARYEFKAETAIRLIKQAGGIAVFAHPVQFDSSLATLPTFLDQLTPFGLDGIEMYYPTQSPSFRKKLAPIAQKNNLLYTGGSDFHGAIRPKSTLGLLLNDSDGKEILEQMQERRVKQHLSC